MLTSVRKRNDKYIIYFVTNEAYNDEHKYNFICNSFSEDYGAEFEVRHVKDGNRYLTISEFLTNKKTYKKLKL